MSFRALLYAYVIGGITFLPLVAAAIVAWTIYMSEAVDGTDALKQEKSDVEKSEPEPLDSASITSPSPSGEQANVRKGWLTVRRQFDEEEFDSSYVNLMRSFIDSRSQRPKDMWYVVLKGNVMYLYMDETMVECEAAIQLPSYDVVVYPEGLQDGELFTRRTAICLKPNSNGSEDGTASSSSSSDPKEEKAPEDKQKPASGTAPAGNEKKKKSLSEAKEAQRRLAFQDDPLKPTKPWFIFVRYCAEMEDWYHTLVHASTYPGTTKPLEPLSPIFQPDDMAHLVATLDERPDVVPMRWLNAMFGRLFFSVYRTKALEVYLLERLARKLSKVKAPSFLTNISVKGVSVGSTAPTFSKPMLKELTAEGDASVDVHLSYKGEMRATVEATAIISLGQKFKAYSVKLVLAVVLREIEGDLRIKIKRPPTNRLWYAFTQPPHMVISVEPVISDRQIKWSMILKTIQWRLKEVINESIVLPNMDDIPFFNSSSYAHRGGIFADAGHSHNSAPDPTGEEPSTLSDDIISLAESNNAVNPASGPVPNHHHPLPNGINTSPSSNSSSEPTTSASTSSKPTTSTTTTANSTSTSTPKSSGGLPFSEAFSISKEFSETFRRRKPTVPGSWIFSTGGAAAANKEAVSKLEKMELRNGKDGKDAKKVKEGKNLKDGRDDGLDRTMSLPDPDIDRPPSKPIVEQAKRSATMAIPKIPLSDDEGSEKSS